MLVEIYCNEFSQKTIKFKEGLNVVLGTNIGDNSIGKSTFMLIIDFVFGGDDYTNAKDILRNVKDHSIFFKFEFDQNTYCFCRKFVDSQVVYKCNEKYEFLDKNPIPILEYCKWLKSKYCLDEIESSFRDIVGRYSRIYGKENCNEKRPLNVVSKEPDLIAYTALLKLFGLYAPISLIGEQYKKDKAAYTAFTNAQKQLFITKITKRTYLQNQKTIRTLEDELAQLTRGVENAFYDVDSEVAEQAVEIKNSLSRARRQRGILKGKLSALLQSKDSHFSLGSDKYLELKRFFADIDFQTIENIENFHRRLSVVFNSEINEEERKLQETILEYDTIIADLENQLQTLIKNPKVSELVLKKHAEIVRTIDTLQKQNEAYLQGEDLKRKKIDSEERFNAIKKEQAIVLATTLNKKMDEINDFIYNGIYNAPSISFGDKKYDFFTYDDTGTGIAYKGLVVFDLSVLNLTALPFIIHDSLVLKQISDHAISKIMDLYNNQGKQVFISLDKQSSYGENTAAFLEQNAVLKMYPNGGELFGWSWGRKDATREEN